METAATLWSALALVLVALLGVIIGMVVCILIFWLCGRETGLESRTDTTQLIRTVRDAVAMELREWRE